MTADPRPASTVVVLRPGPRGIEVLLVRRHDRVAFMGGAHVFPGGRVDEDDHQRAATATVPAADSRFPDLTARQELVFRHAAVRELREEAAVSLATDALVPIAHWVTPNIEIKRYDTRFFLAVLPEGQHARHDDQETTGLVWCPPSEALGRGLRGEIVLPPPTWTTLRQLERHDTVAAALAWARTTVIVRVEPGFVTDGARRIVTLPGDPAFPATPGWVVPTETRFVLEEGRGWLPVTG